MRNIFILLLVIINLNSFAGTTKNKASVANQKHMLKKVNFHELQNVILKPDNKVYVVNFWATWCTPCVKELPEFMEVNKMYKNKPNFKMILVSLDMVGELETGVRPFLVKNGIDADVYLLDDNKRMNEWIPAIDAKWTGAIPATVFYRNGKKLEFREGKIQKSDLEQLINKYL